MEISGILLFYKLVIFRSHSHIVIFKKFNIYIYIYSSKCIVKYTKKISNIIYHDTIIHHAYMFYLSVVY